MIEKDTRCAICDDVIPAGTPAADYAEYIHYTSDMLIDHVDQAHRDCAVATGDKRWDYDK
jgi:hypothetical protein